MFSELIPKGSASMTILTHGLDDDAADGEEDGEDDGEEEVAPEDLDVDDTEGALSTVP